MRLGLIGLAALAGLGGGAHAAESGRLLLLPDSAIQVQPGSIEEQLATYLASSAPAPRLFRFGGPEYEPWQTRPTPETLRTMYAIQQILRAYPKVDVTLIGHTDNDGTPTQNRALSLARARQMQQLLVQGGVAARRITVVGKGLDAPIADNATPEGRARNRRIELVVTRK
jgi:outer membrane protein OmpA-like peptidoglycan-associated protein